MLPRLADPGRPVLVVVGGSTGVGKSTLVNTLVGTPVTQSGLARPTTRSPVLVHHPVDTARFGSDEILPTFTRTDRATNDPGQIQLVPAASLPQGVALLDAPVIGFLSGVAVFVLILISSAGLLIGALIGGAASNTSDHQLREVGR